MKIAILIVRLLLGLMFTVFGSNFFFHFIPMQTPTGDAGVFMTGLMASKYFMPLLGTCQLLCGLSFLTNKFVPLFLIVLLPINLNIILFHAALDPGGIGMGVVTLLMNVFLMYAYRDHYLHFKKHDAKHSHHD